MRLPALLPYAIVAALVAVGSSAAVVATARPARIGTTSSATAAPSAGVRPGPELSKTARLAYWRERKLWISDLSGSLRYAVASTDDVRRISLTRWSLDGSAVAFVDSASSVAIVTTRGARIDVDLPIELRDAGYRVADVRWSPDARHIAATLLRPGDGRSDAFIIDLGAARPAWSRLTTLEDLFIGDWISNDELLGYTASGVIGIVGVRAPNTMRLLTGAPGVTPIIGPDGRIHFLVGRVPVTRDRSLPFVTANRASAWSVAADGSDMRRESTWELNDLRLDARLPDGRYLAHRGSSTAQGSVGDDLELLPTGGGVIERVRVSPEGRTAYGFTPERIVRVDLTTLGAPAPVTGAGAVTVFLETSGDADIWFPMALSLARGGARADAGPAARYVLSYGSHIWHLERGVASLVRPAPVLRRIPVPAPRWDPTGERFAVIEQAGPAAPSTSFIALAVDRAGDAVRLAQTQAAARSYAWSPTGTELAVAVDRKGASGIASDAQLEVRFVDPAGRITRPAVPATDVAWTTKGLLIIADGGAGPALQRLDGDTPATTLVTRDRLASDPRASTPQRAAASIGTLDASRDGQFASLRLQTRDATISRSFVVLLGADGTALQYLRANDLQDLAWSPTRPLLGYTLDARTTNERAVIASPTSGQQVATQDGRFAGWSPDGQWYLVGRIQGLFAYPLAGGAAVRVGPVSVPVNAAPLR